MQSKQLSHGRFAMNTQYTIIVEGRLPPHWSGEFGALRIDPLPDGTTSLAGPIRDQSDLLGQIRRIEQLGLRLISVNEVKADR